MGKNIWDHRVEAAKIYRQLSKAAIAGNRASITARELRTALLDAGFSDKKKDGSKMEDAGVRLQVNKALGAIKASGLANGDFADTAAYDKWKADRFVQIRAPKIIEGITGIIGDLD